MLTTSLATDIALYFLVFITVLYFYFTRHFGYWRKRNVPFAKPLPFVGNFWNGFTMQQSMGEIFDGLHRSSEAPFLGFFILDKPCLLIRDIQLIKNVLNKDFKHFDDRNSTNNEKADPIGSNVLFMLKNPKWKNIRTKISPVFSSAKIKVMSKLIIESGHDLVKYLEEKSKINPVLDTKDTFQRYTVEVITSTIFGVQADCFKEKNSEILKIAKTIFDWDDMWNAFQIRAYFVAPALVDWFNLKLINPKTSKYLKNLFLNIMQERIAINTSRNDLIDLLLQMKKDCPNFLEGDTLVAQAVNFFGAGYETSSSTMAFAVYEISKNQVIQAKLRNEIHAISEKHGGISYEALQEMTYLETCIKETLRKYPILPYLDRNCKFAYKVPNSDLVIEKGTGVFISVYSLHNDPQYYPNPEVFNPARFSSDSHLHQDSMFLGFGAGPRNCIGERFGMLTVKAGLACIFQNFITTPCPETQTTMVFDKNGNLLSPLNGIKLKFCTTKKD